MVHINEGTMSSNILLSM